VVTAFLQISVEMTIPLRFFESVLARLDRMQKQIFLLLAATLCSSAGYSSGAYVIQENPSDVDRPIDIGMMQSEAGDAIDHSSEAIKYQMTTTSPEEKMDADAAYNLGAYYDFGERGFQNAVEAAKWYALAAGEGHAKAQSALGLFYNNGIGVAKDLAKAAELYRLAAIQGDDVAQLNLGVMITRVEGVPENDLGGLMLMGLAARGGNQLAKENLVMAGIDHTDLKFEELLDTCIKITLVKCFEVNSELAASD